MAVVGALIAAEKTLPWRRPVTYATALVLVALGLMLVAGAGRTSGADDPRQRRDDGHDPLSQALRLRS